MPVGTHPHLLAVGVGNPMAVLCLAWMGARRDEILRLRSADQQLSGSLSTEGFQNIICTPAPRLPARLVRYFYSWLDTPHVPSCPRAGHVYSAFYSCGENGTGGYELAAGV
jgi:hypothetical protein